MEIGHESFQESCGGNERATAVIGAVYVYRWRRGFWFGRHDRDTYFNTNG